MPIAFFVASISKEDKDYINIVKLPIKNPIKTKECLKNRGFEISKISFLLEWRYVGVDYKRQILLRRPMEYREKNIVC